MLKAILKKKIFEKDNDNIDEKLKEVNGKISDVIFILKNKLGNNHFNNKKYERLRKIVEKLFYIYEKIIFNNSFRFILFSDFNQIKKINHGLDEIFEIIPNEIYNFFEKIIELTERKMEILDPLFFQRIAEEKIEI